MPSMGGWFVGPGCGRLQAELIVQVNKLEGVLLESQNGTASSTASAQLPAHAVCV